MEAKKSKKANLENKRGIFLQVGIIVALAMILIAFEWSSGQKDNLSDISMIQDIVFEEEMIVTRREEPKPKEELPKVLEVLDIVDDDVVIEDDFILDVEVDENTVVDFVVYDDEEEVVEDDVPFVIVSNMPKFRGGDLMEFWKYCNENIRYPEIAAENGVSGTVTVQFVVNKQGNVVDAVVLRGVDPALDAEALRVINSSPKWTPGDNRGLPASVLMNIPIKFILQ